MNVCTKHLQFNINPIFPYLFSTVRFFFNCSFFSLHLYILAYTLIPVLFAQSYHMAMMQG